MMGHHRRTASNDVFIDETAPLIQASLRTSRGRHEAHARVLTRAKRFGELLSSPLICPTLIALSLFLCANLSRRTDDGFTTAAKNTWSAGSVYAGILVLQLSCLSQPAGSLILDGALGTWRFSPIYCLLDMASMSLSFIALVLVDCCSLPKACSILMAARYRSFRIHPAQPLMALKAKAASIEGTRALVLRDIDAIFEQASKRRILASLIGTLTVLQYAKIISMQGSPAMVIPTKVLATVFFLYWATNESASLALRFLNRYVESDAISAALHVRRNWQFTVDGEGNDTFRAPLAIFGGLVHICASVAVAMAVFRVGTGGIRVHGVLAPTAISGLATTFMVIMPVFLVYISFWRVIDFQAGLGTPSIMLHLWFTNQAVQISLLALLYYCCIYDSDKTSKAEWTEWIP